MKSEIFILTALWLCRGSYSKNYISNRFRSTHVFNHSIIDRVTGKVYIGAVNRLYQLSESLVEESEYLTGPKNDNPNCPPQGVCTCVPGDNCDQYRKVPTDSVNKGLAIDYVSNILVVCTNLLQGHCEKRNLGEISRTPNNMGTNSIQIVVPNDPSSSAVIFIDKGPAMSLTPKGVLYVGATRSKLNGLDAYKDLVPAVASRNLDNFELAHRSSFSGSTKVEIASQLQDIFFVDYIYGFGSGGFSYFVTVQKTATSSQKYASRMVRVCQKDPAYYSYAEVPLECNQSGTSYNIALAAYLGKAGEHLARNMTITPAVEDVLYVLFAKSQPNSKVPLKKTVLCMYPMRSVRSQFTKNIQNCFKGIGNTGPAHINTPQPCTLSNYNINDDYCGTHNFNTPIGGTIPVSATPVISFDNTLLTAIAVSPVANYTVAFLGTENGQLKKVVLESSFHAQEYETVSVDTTKVNSDLHFSPNKQEYIYVMTKQTISRVKVQDCAQYLTCDKCLAAKDPYCGWCALENKCTIQDTCPNANQGMRWLPYSGYRCTNITNVLPRQVQIDPTKTTALQLTVENLPGLPQGDQYHCMFKGYDVTRTTSATKDNVTVQCDTPYPNLLPPIPTGNDHIKMQLSIGLKDKEIVSTNFTFFNCEVHTSCTSCTQSDYPCNWCIQNHRCVYHREVCGKGEVLVTGKNTPGTSDRVGPGMCPRIESSDTKILVPSGHEENIIVTAVNLKDFQIDLRCYFNIDGGVEVNARLVVSNTGGIKTIKCDPTRFSYPEDTGVRNVPFKITWGTAGKAIDNPTGIQGTGRSREIATLEVYKCSALADNCGSCLILDSKYGCGWCVNFGCNIRGKCAREWLSSSSTCPNPQIFRFYPTSGPKEGGTNITIEGANLGKKQEDIKDGISVAGEPCKPYYFSQARIIKCVTGASPSEQFGRVKIVVNTNYIAESTTDFHYVEPVILNINPTFGLVSGGTKLKIIGKYMNAGSHIMAMVGGLPCEVISKNENTAECITSASDKVKNGSIMMKFDRAEVRFDRQLYSYVPNPTVTSVDPEKGILSGGVMLKVRGTGLGAVQDPMMFARVYGVDYISDCNVTSYTTMKCFSPDVNASGLVTNANEPKQIPYGFIMQKVRVTRNNSNQGTGVPKFSIYPNPQFMPFKGGVMFFQSKSDYLTIDGNNLNHALKESDIIVRIGTGYCNVTSIGMRQLNCKPPSRQPSQNGGSSPNVFVHVGNLTFPIGRINFEEPAGTLPIAVIIGVSVAIGIAVIIIVIIFMAYCRKSQESDRVMKRMQTQMDVLESRVAKECKEAFAELQTDMTELTQDMASIGGIPFLDYRSFCMRVLFPTMDECDHPVCRALEVDLNRKETIEKGLRLFDALIGNKTFLLVFIRTLEGNKNFSMRDRVNVASLLSVTLQGRMEYHTDILKTLLAELIEKTVESKNNPKLLLRRTESVAEKMLTNWFTFLLFKFLKECAGEPLFMLFTAIKAQVSKGPVDAVTSEAKYSLSEDKLIRQQIDYRTITLNVIEYDATYGVQEHPVRVLDCDTISQVKDKILDIMYRNSPFSNSNRPRRDALDLEWVTGVQGRIVLQDEDVTSKTEGDYKQVNTLQHYKVPDGAKVSLIPRQSSSSYNLSLLSDRSAYSHRYDYVVRRAIDLWQNASYFAGSPQLSRSISPNTISIDLENSGVKFYHLVKQHDVNDNKEGDRGNKMVSEIYLTRLLATKGTLQQYVDDLFETIFSTAHRGSALPLAIKYMFDFLDDQALHHAITDPETVHTWKSNSLPLRFWVNVIKNPDFVFDSHKSNIVDSCLSVIAQTFMDSCSMKEHRLGKDSPSSKLLYAKDIPKYKKWVERYYQDIKMMPAISDQDMGALLSEESRHQKEFNVSAALNELYNYVIKYNDQLLQNLEEDEFARTYKLAYKLEQVHGCMESEV
ncbi:plexin-A4-like isoform X2 [Lineus longissimus]|uniref:plexin-A4-like isoform X2 n=1 Tax=Lineus longissimus TaxID=88925 RepID=UPI00315D4885